MLARLNISNLAVIDEVELDFNSGMTALTGETGAGKSILVDALALALGERADSRAVRTGSKRCSVTAEFILGDNTPIKQWLEHNDLDADGECILRRVVTTDGRSRGYINSHSVPMQTLREIGEKLIDICGQQAHQSLRHPTAQLAMVDGFGGNTRLLEKMSTDFTQWQSLQTEFENLQDAQSDRSARLELLSFQVTELESLKLERDEWQQLGESLTRMANAGRIAGAIDSSLAALFDNGSTSDGATAQALIAKAQRDLSGVAEFDGRLKPITAMLSEADIMVTEAADALRHHADGQDHDPAEQQRIEERLATIHSLARKHRVEPSELSQLAEKLSLELDSLTNSDERLEQLQAQAEAAEAEVQKTAKKLSRARAKAAKEIAKQVTLHLRELGLGEGRFEIDLTPSTISATGSDRAEFNVAMNPGQAPGPLAKIASGGELSRVSLALQLVGMSQSGVPTLIFDEVDAGVGGGVAEIVGARLSELSAQRQVLCVTHLPQVASQANQHLCVEKTTDGKSTQTSVQSLAAAERVEEIARMLGGVKVTETTRAHAAEMLD